MTRIHVRLLGPCFKTGRVGHRLLARRERVRGCAPPLHDRRRAARTPVVSPARTRLAKTSLDVGVPIRPGLRRPQQRVAASWMRNRGKYARRRRLEGGRAQTRLSREPHGSPADLCRRAEYHGLDLRGPTRLALNGFTYY